MLTVEEALAEVMKEARPLPPAERSLLDSRGAPERGGPEGHSGGGPEGHSELPS